MSTQARAPAPRGYPHAVRDAQLYISARQAREAVERALWLLKVPDSTIPAAATMVLYSEILHRQALIALANALSRELRCDARKLAVRKRTRGTIAVEAGGISVLSLGSHVGDLAIATARDYGCGTIIATNVGDGGLAAGLPAATADRDKRVRMHLSSLDPNGKPAYASSNCDFSWLDGSMSTGSGTLVVASSYCREPVRSSQVARRLIVDGIQVSSAVWQMLHARSREVLLPIDRG